VDRGATEVELKKASPPQNPAALSPQPSTLNPKPRNPETHTLNPTPATVPPGVPQAGAGVASRQEPEPAGRGGGAIQGDPRGVRDPERRERARLVWLAPRGHPEGEP